VTPRPLLELNQATVVKNGVRVLDSLSLKFAIYLRSARLEGLDVGCGEGVATLAALARGARMVAVDPDLAALHDLLARVPGEQYRRVKVRQDSIPDMDFKFTLLFRGHRRIV